MAATQVVVLVPGILGSELELNGKTVWPGDLLRLNGPYPNLNDLLDPAVVATDVIRNICVSKQYVTLIDSLAGFGFPEKPAGGAGQRLVIAPYDWRKDNADSAATLERLIQAVVAASPEARITLLAHSMGGYVARYYLESGRFQASAGYGSVAALIMLATPSGGAVSALETILGQRDSYFMSRDQVKQFSADPRYPSVYQLLPAPGTPFLWDGAAGDALNIRDLYDPATASALGLSDANLKSAADFHGSLSLDRKPSAARYFTFVGTQFQTTSACLLIVKDGNATISAIQPDDSGDGTVPIWGAQLPGVQQVQVGGSHPTIYQDGTLLQYLKQLLAAGPEPLHPASLASQPPTMQVQLQVRDQVISSGGAIHVALNIPGLASSAEAAKTAALSATAAVPGALAASAEIRVEPVLVDISGTATGFGAAVLREPVAAVSPRSPRRNLLLPASIPPGPYRVGYYPAAATSGKPSAYAFIAVGPAVAPAGVVAPLASGVAAALPKPGPTPGPTMAPLCSAYAILRTILQGIAAVPFLPPATNKAIAVFLGLMDRLCPAPTGVEPDAPAASASLSYESIDAKVRLATIRHWQAGFDVSSLLMAAVPGSNDASDDICRAYAALKPALDFARKLIPEHWRVALNSADEVFDVICKQARGVQPLHAAGIHPALTIQSFLTTQSLRAPGMSKITINGITVDPVSQAPSLAAANLISADASGTDYILIQTRQPLSTQQKQELLSLGAQILEYVPENTYVCHYPPPDLARIRALPYVAWANTYMRSFKIAPSLAGPAGPVARTTDLMALAMAPVRRSMAQTPTLVDVRLHRNANTEKACEKIAAAARIDPKSLKASGHKFRLTVQPEFLPSLAAIDEVRSIEKVLPAELQNNVARQVLRADNIILNGTVFQGQGQVVAVCDTGFDKGSTTDTHPAFTGRVAKLYPLGRPSTDSLPGGDAGDPNGHGTHVAGSVLGDGASALIGGPICGTAPRAALVLQSALDANGGLGGLPDDLNQLFAGPYADDGARVHTNSWATNAAGQYTANSHEVDEFVFAHRDCVVCFAAGNYGRDGGSTGHIDAGSVGSPATAKNCIAVGASENNRPDFSLTYGAGWPNDFPAGPIASDRVADNVEGMVAFSSRGLTADGRIKPDVVAPGSAVLSTRSSQLQIDNGGWGISQDPLFMFDGGTSMSTPLVAGCCAVIREYLIKAEAIPSPSAALVKALLINGARKLAGQYVPPEVSDIPNLSEGFGRVDLTASIGPRAAGETVSLWDEANPIDVGQQQTFTVTVPPGATLLKATLVWTDPPGETLQNDLDLIVRDSSGQECHGNNSVGAAGFDRSNNVEQVAWPGVPAGNAQVIVTAYRITQSSQTFALVVRVS